MRTNLRIAVLAVGVVALAACSDTAPAASTEITPAPEMAVTASPASTSLSPTSATTTTAVPVATTFPASGEVLGVPTLMPPEIDGILGQGEWDGAVSFSMSDGIYIDLMQAAGTLYVAVEGNEVGAVNVVIATAAEVWILHSSAALGSALYKPDTEVWQLVHGFGWCCRDRNNDTDRLALLDEEGWQANIGSTGGPGIVEYQIALPWQGSSIAVSSIRDEDDTGFWPTDLSDEARLQLLGPPPPTRAFNTGEWRVLADG